MPSLRAFGSGLAPAGNSAGEAVMADLGEQATVDAMLHELAEGLQATGGYIAALRRHRLGVNGTGPIDLEIIERALSQWARARHASQELHSLLLDQALPPPSNPVS